MLFESVLWGIIGGLITALATLTGGALILYQRNPSKPGPQALSRIFTFEFIIGMMVAASAYSLILPAYQQVQSDYLRHLLIFPLIIGVLFILGSQKLIEVFKPQNKSEANSFRTLD